MSVDKKLMTIGYDDYDVVELCHGVYKINEFNLTTMFVIVGQEKAVTIDCGTGIGDYMAVIRRITDLPVSLIVTHAHVDHIGGRGQFDVMYMSQEDESIIKDVTVASRKGYVALMKLLGFKVRKKRDMRYDKVTKEPRVEYLRDGDVIDLGGKTLTVYAIPGHTFGSLGFGLKEDRILFTGDVVNPQCLMFLKHAATLEVMKSSCQRILSLSEYDTIWASHLSDPIDRDTVLRAIATIEQAQKRGNRLLPWIIFENKNDFAIIHRANKRK